MPTAKRPRKSTTCLARCYDNSLRSREKKGETLKRRWEGLYF